MVVVSKARHDLTLRAIKREIQAGRDVAFWLDKAYQHYDSGLFTEADIAEVEGLAMAHYDALDASEAVEEQPIEDADAAAGDAAGGVAVEGAAEANGAVEA